MKVKMDSLVITDYCSQDKRKIRFIKEISEDPLVCYYVSPIIHDQIEASEGVKNIEIGHTYIIEDNRKLIGFIRLAYLDTDGVLQLHYGVHPDHRKQNYGSKILKETSSYIFNKFSTVKKIQLNIKERNKGSIACAENALFTLEREFESPQSDTIIKVYTKAK